MQKRLMESNPNSFRKMVANFRGQQGAVTGRLRRRTSSAFANSTWRSRTASRVSRTKLVLHGTRVLRPVTFLQHRVAKLDVTHELPFFQYPRAPSHIKPGGGRLLIVRSPAHGRGYSVCLCTLFSKTLQLLISNQKTYQMTSCRVAPSSLVSLSPSWTYLVHPQNLYIFGGGYSVQRKTPTRAHNGDALVSVQRRSRIVREAFRTLACVDTQFASLDASQPPANLPGIASPSSVRERGTNVVARARRYSGIGTSSEPSTASERYARARANAVRSSRTSRPTAPSPRTHRRPRAVPRGSP